ncbi:hypothetical protein [Mucilaginibacter ginsenosidivorans]|uniref:Uncharacterized protein n=1 Tax=Mucilaginibacter ginsenosidivorans TaxID=398053 RepID=A0A5B8UU70_9SPHI|nr:hypothetical protein [Mucilaginibacter ginsenosidivorans]QEC61986.1 hypothetical protein FRZ54_05080 [Mucilaginibacter ginsenosidivorans]
MNQTHDKVNIYNGVMDLLVNDIELNRKADELILEALKLHQFVEVKYKSLKSALVGLNMHMPNISMGNLRKMSAEIKDFVTNQIKDYEKTKDEAIKDFYKQRGEYFKPVMEKLHGFKILAKLYLLK